MKLAEIEPVTPRQLSITQTSGPPSHRVPTVHLPGFRLHRKPFRPRFRTDHAQTKRADRDRLHPAGKLHNEPSAL